MLRPPIIPILKAHQIFLIESSNMQSSIAIEMQDSRRVLDDQQKSGWALLQEVVR